MVQVFFCCCSCQLCGPSVLLLLLLSALWSKCSSTVAPVSSVVQVFFYCCSCRLYGPSVLLLLLLSALWSKCSSTVASVSSMVQVFFCCCSCQLYGPSVLLLLLLSVLWSKCSSTVAPVSSVSSMKATTPGIPCRICSIVRWNRAGAEEMPKADLFTPLFTCQYFGQKVSVIQGVCQ